MPIPLSAAAVLDREFLEMRAKLLELAASFDRLDRADGDVRDDRRLRLLREAIELLLDDPGDRAEQLQLLFSRSYDDNWQHEFNLTTVR